MPKTLEIVLEPFRERNILPEEEDYDPVLYKGGELHSTTVRRDGAFVVDWLHGAGRARRSAPRTGETESMSRVRGAK